MTDLRSGTCLVRASLTPHDQRLHVPPATLAVRMLVRGPNTPRTAVVLHITRAENALPSTCCDRTFIDEHLIAGYGETDPAWLSLADVIVVGRRNASTTPNCLADAYTRFPGCLVMALDHPGRGILVQTAAGRRIRLFPWQVAGSPGDASVYASLIHTWMVADRALSALQAARIAIWPGGDSRSSRHGVAFVTG